MKIHAIGNTEWKRFGFAIGKLLSVSYEELQRRLAKENRKKEKKKRDA